MRSVQSMVARWMREVFSADVRKDVLERCFRFLEEALELVQSLGMTREQCIRVVDYVYRRPAGEVKQEVGGTIVTLAALCNSLEIDAEDCGRAEVERCWTHEMVEKIRSRQREKRSAMQQ